MSNQVIPTDPAELSVFALGYASAFPEDGMLSNLIRSLVDALFAEPTSSPEDETEDEDKATVEFTFTATGTAEELNAFVDEVASFTNETLGVPLLLTQ